MVGMAATTVQWRAAAATATAALYFTKSRQGPGLARRGGPVPSQYSTNKKMVESFFYTHGILLAPATQSKNMKSFFCQKEAY